MSRTRDPRWLEFPTTFTCEPLLFVLGRMMPGTKHGAGPTVAAEPTEAARLLATELSREVIVVDNRELLVMLAEPFEAVAAARAHDLRPASCIASGLALELLRGNETWAWLCGHLRIAEARPYQNGVVRVDGVASTELPSGCDEIPPGPGVWLWIRSGDGTDRLLFVDRRSTIGRARAGQPVSSDVEIGVEDRIISREHAEIRPFGNTWLYEDRKSLGGTMLDGSRITKICLVPGMVIVMGSSQLIVLSVR